MHAAHAPCAFRQRTRVPRVCQSVAKRVLNRVRAVCVRATQTSATRIRACSLRACAKRADARRARLSKREAAHEDARSGGAEAEEADVPERVVARPGGVRREHQHPQRRERQPRAEAAARTQTVHRLAVCENTCMVRLIRSGNCAC
eukprot:6175810-Pleurochrysis_carterae.AAC.1